MSKSIWLVTLVLIGVAGCGQMYQKNPETEKYELTPAGQTVDKVVEGVDAISQQVSLLIPGFAAIAGVISGAASVWRAYKSKMESISKDVEIKEATAESLVAAIEEFKTKFPEAWAQLKPCIQNAVLGLDTAEDVLNFISTLKNALTVEVVEASK